MSLAFVQSGVRHVRHEIFRVVMVSIDGDIGGSVEEMVLNVTHNCHHFVVVGWIMPFRICKRQLDVNHPQTFRQVLRAGESYSVRCVSESMW